MSQVSQDTSASGASSLMRGRTTKPRRMVRYAEVFGMAIQADFDQSLSNGDGTFSIDKLKDHPKHGEIWATLTPTKRRLLFIGTHLGTVLIYDRYRPVDGVFHVSAARDVIRGRWFSADRLSDDQMEVLLGEVGNQGIRGGISDIIKDLRESVINIANATKMKGA